MIKCNYDEGELVNCLKVNYVKRWKQFIKFEESWKLLWSMWKELKYYVQRNLLVLYINSSANSEHILKGKKSLSQNSSQSVENLIPSLSFSLSFCLSLSLVIPKVNYFQTIWLDNFVSSLQYYQQLWLILFFDEEAKGIQYVEWHLVMSFGWIMNNRAHEQQR